MIARFSPNGGHRYELRHRWADEGSTVAWVMLNPSIAGQGVTGDDLDPTLRRCMGFSRAMGAGSMVILNLYSFVGTNPLDLWAAMDAGVDVAGGLDGHNALIEGVSAADLVVCGWGAFSGARRRHVAKAERRAKGMVQLIRERGHTPLALRLTRSGQPCHPLYLPGNLRPVPMEALCQSS